MVDLGKTYADAGLILAPAGCPTTCPRCSSSCPPATATGTRLLGEIAHILNAVHTALQQRGSHYAAVLAASRTGRRAHSVEIAPEPDIDEGLEPQAFDGCSTPARLAPTPQTVHFVRDRASTTKSELPNEPHSQLVFGIYPYICLTVFSSAA